jgi:ferredoxin-type protein NapF
LCHACLAACPTGVLAKGHAGYPIVVFAEARCTFCGACAQACDAGCFDRAGGRPPWPLKAGITRACVERKGVSCRMCQEVCEAGAIRFRPQLGGGSSPSIDVAACTGCGACVAPCPVEAVTITAPEAMEACA